MKKVMVLIPALDPSDIFPSYVRQLFDSGFTDILVVDDGSSSDTCFLQLQHMGCVVLKHSRNQGKGQALKTGLSYYKEHFNYEEYAGVITADSDGQHLCKDVQRIAQRLAAGTTDLVLGSRDFTLPQVPPKSRFGNNLTSWIFRCLLRFQVSDTQTGLRGIPNCLIDACLKVPGKRFEYETAMLTQVGRTSGILEIPIETVYYEENKGTHFNPIVDSIKIYRMIFGTFFRYIFSSLSSFVLDILLFTIFSKFILAGIPHRILVSTGFARLFSAFYNFCINRNVVFKSEESYVSCGIRYLLLCILQAACSALCTEGLYWLLKIDEVAVKILVDTFLFFISYNIQNRFIFPKGRKNQ